MNSISQIVEVMNVAFEKNLKFEMPVNGTSMLPFIHAGDLVTLEKITNSQIKKKDVIFYKRDNGQYVLHRVYKIKNNCLFILGDNQLNIEKNVRYDQVIAKMVSYKTKNKTILVTSFAYRFKVSLWNVYFIRCIVLKAKWLLLKLKRK